MMNWRRVLRVVKKELTQIRRDKRMLLTLFAMPIMQLFIFGYAVSTDVNHILTAVYDEDRSAESRMLVERFTRSGYFDEVAYLTSPAQVNRTLDTGQAQMVLHIPRRFARALRRQHPVQVQTILDGTDSMTARIIAGYANAVVRQYAAGVTLDRLNHMRAVTQRVPGLEPRLRVWYNPELKSVNFMVPGVLCLILFIVTMTMTSMAIVREKEIGTLEQLIVTPITPTELMLGKTVPFLLIGLLDMALVLLVATCWFHVRVAGSVTLLIMLSVLFLLTSLGLGIFVSTVSKTQQEATLSSFFILQPSIILSGYMFPVENMPAAIQWITYLIPLRYFLEIIRGIFLKGNGLAQLWPQVLVLTAFGITILLLSAVRFNKRIG